MDDFPHEDHFRQEMGKARSELNLEPGDLYEDCVYHPVVCVEVDYDQDEITGVSMIDGSHPRSCSLRFCGVRKLTVEEAWNIKHLARPTARPEIGSQPTSAGGSRAWARCRPGAVDRERLQ